MASKKKHHKPAAPPAPMPPAVPWRGLLIVSGALALLLATVAATVLLRRRQPTPAPPPPVIVQAERPLLEPQDQVYARYAGSASCKECHRKAYDAWAESNHGLAERNLRPELDKAAFDPPRSFTHATQTTSVKLVDGKAAVTTLGFDNKVESYIVARAIGHDPIRQFLVPAPGGRYQTLEATWDPYKEEWFNVYGTEDRVPGEWGHWTGRGMNWNTMCAACHNTRVRKNYDPASDTFRTAMTEPTVSCEACHGPMKAHVEYATKHFPESKVRGWPPVGLTTRPALTDPTLARHSRDQILDNCASCHARRTELTGDPAPGDRFFDHYHLSIVDESDTWYPDGQIREENYEFTAFLGSRMHAAGVRCIDCHDVHGGGTLLPGNAMCMKCHTAPTKEFPTALAIDPKTHSFHKPGTAGDNCVDCHMPVTTYMQRHPRHDHGFTSPDPLLTKQFGIPNACNRCHTDKTVDWSIEYCDKWYGAKMQRPARPRTTAIAQARQGQAVARDGLLSILNDPKETPYWKAVAAGLLDPWVAQTPARDALIAQLKHEHPLVRATAVQTLANFADADASLRNRLELLLRDPSRNVRLAAAHAMQATLAEKSSVGREYLHFLEINADQPTGQAQWAQWFASRRDNDKAVEHFARAVQWDSRSAGLRQQYAVLLSVLGRPREALTQLERAVQLEPASADLHYFLALSRHENADTPGARAALRRAVELNPRFARAWYNLGLLDAQNDPQRAIESLQRAEAIEPNDADFPYARATILMHLQRVPEARQAALRAIQINPGHREAAMLLRGL